MTTLSNFWATWCPPCRKEMPDLDRLYRQFKKKGLVVLAVSDEDKNKVASFRAQHSTTFPILLDPGRKVNELFRVQDIPKSFVYNRDGKLVTESIDMRSREQFLAMLAAALPTECRATEGGGFMARGVPGLLARQFGRLEGLRRKGSKPGDLKTETEKLDFEGRCRYE